jgi:hypothetical protein
MIGLTCSPGLILRSKDLLREESQMTELRYKGYLIIAKPARLRSGRWNMDTEISVSVGDTIYSKPYLARNTFTSKEEAIAACLDFGRRIVDGQIEGLSAPDR